MQETAVGHDNFQPGKDKFSIMLPGGCEGLAATNAACI